MLILINTLTDYVFHYFSFEFSLLINITPLTSFLIYESFFFWLGMTQLLFSHISNKLFISPVHLQVGKLLQVWPAFIINLIFFSISILSIISFFNFYFLYIVRILLQTLWDLMLKIILLDEITYQFSFNCAWEALLMIPQHIQHILFFILLFLLLVLHF